MLRVQGRRLRVSTCGSLLEVWDVEACEVDATDDATDAAEQEPAVLLKLFYFKKVKITARINENYYASSLILLVKVILLSQFHNLTVVMQIKMHMGRSGRD